MGFMDKLKNIFFEEEEEDEIEEPVSPKQEKKEREDKSKPLEESTETKKEKLKEVIAKKVELPKRGIKEKTEIDEIDLSEALSFKEKEDKKEEVKVEKPKEEVKIKKEPKINQELIFDDEDFILDTKPKIKKEQIILDKPKNIESNLYKGKEIKNKEERKETKFDYSKTTYGNKKEEIKPKTFTPSPIISPIYGILDKNYKKEEVKENKEIRISSRPSRMDLDSIRNKAFGDLEYDLNLIDEREDKKEKIKENTVSRKKSEENIRKIYSKKNNEDDKPSIERVTIGEADEYYNDLGLAYNTDYKDLSKDLSDGKVEKKEKKDNNNLEDNLFDLIESMYDKDRDL